MNSIIAKRCPDQRAKSPGRLKAPDTTGIGHADYVTGMRGRETNRHLAALSQPNVTNNRAQRRAIREAVLRGRLAALRGVS